MHVGLVPVLALSLASLAEAEAEALLTGFAEDRSHAAAQPPTSVYMCMHETHACIYVCVRESDI